MPCAACLGLVGGQWPNGRACRTADILRAAAGLALLVSVAVAGHEAAGPDVALALPAAVLHLASMAVWLGGLVVLGLAVLPALRRGTIADAGLRRWSITAYSCVICLVVTGEYQASRQISPVQALWSTRYGVFLLVKVALVAVMLAAALLAERHVMGAAVPGRLVRAVRRSVGIEVVTAVLVLAVRPRCASPCAASPRTARSGPPAPRSSRCRGCGRSPSTLPSARPTRTPPPPATGSGDRLMASDPRRVHLARGAAPQPAARTSRLLTASGRACPPGP